MIMRGSLVVLVISLYIFAAAVAAFGSDGDDVVPRIKRKKSTAPPSLSQTQQFPAVSPTNSKATWIGAKLPDDE